jgi:integrase
VDVSAFGERHTKTFSILTLAREWKSQVKTTPPPEPVTPEAARASQRENMTLKAWVDRWLTDLEHEATQDKLNGLSPSTIAGYKRKLNYYAIPHLGHELLSSLDPLMLSDWIKTVQKKHSTNAAYEAHRRLKGCLSAAVRFALIPSNPCAGLQPPKGVKSEKSKSHDASRWSSEEATRVLAVLDADSRSPIRFMIKVWLATGLRREEILGLRWQDVDLKEQVLTVRHVCIEVNGKMQLRLKTKTGVERQVSFDLYARDALEAQRDKNLEFKAARAIWVENDLVFPNESGMPFSMTLFQKWYSRLCESAKVERIRPYDIRSTHGSALHFNLGMDDVMAAERMGHSVSTYLKTYVRPLEAERKATPVLTKNLFSPQTKRKQNPKKPLTTETKNGTKKKKLPSKREFSFGDPNGT